MTTGMVLRRRVTAIFGTALIALVAAAGVAVARPAQNIPSPPSTFFGSINDAAGPVQAGLPVEGLINGKVCSSKGGKTEHTGSGKAQITVYAVDIESDSQTPGCGKQGSVVTIKIGDRTAQQTGKWDAGPVKLDITFGDVTPLPIPTFTPTSTGTPAPTVSIGTQTPRPTTLSSAVPGGVTGSPSAAASAHDSGGGFPIWAIVLIVVAALAVAGGGAGLFIARNHRADGDGPEE
ncbi:MAG TPA: hypothetical protein VJQ83_05750 [Tepidiformaceae bacterium]|nr:hypothetical protein [Tepidiformaceae bacterium]